MAGQCFAQPNQGVRRQSDAVMRRTGLERQPR